MSVVLQCPTAGHYPYERHGILVANDALELAAQQCIDDTDFGTSHRTPDQLHRAEVDARYRDEFAAAIRAEFPSCPPTRVTTIAYYAALRSRGGARRSSAAHAPGPDDVRLAVTDSVRHVDTDYDDLLMAGIGRDDARIRVHDSVARILDAWRSGATDLDS